jgi:DNA invertase Pin-like site-specific DNA recombinase
MNEKKQKAVIYCHGEASLVAQETLCREYAKSEDYEIIEIFHENISGDIPTRPLIDKMLVWIKENRADSPVVIIDDFSRLARTQALITARNMAIIEAGGRLRSVSFKPDEHVHALQGATNVFLETLFGKTK